MKPCQQVAKLDFKEVNCPYCYFKYQAYEGKDISYTCKRLSNQQFAGLVGDLPCSWQDWIYCDFNDRNWPL